MKADKNNDNNLSLSEICELLNDVNIQIDKSNAEELFKVFLLKTIFIKLEQ